MATTSAEPEELDKAFLSIRRAIGRLGFFLPIILFAIGTWFGNVEDSISDFYYSDGRDVFVAYLSAIAIFFLAYTGHRQGQGEIISDSMLGNITGIAALGVVFIPTGGTPTPRIHEMLGPGFAVGLHLACASVFFGCLAAFSYFKFQRGDETDALKQRRNAVHRGCAYTIAAMMVLMFLNWLVHRGDRVMFYDGWNPVFWLESIAVWAFAVSWLVKGQELENTVLPLLGLAPPGQGAP